MFRANRSGFDWKEIAEVLRLTAAAPATFWREIRHSRSKEIVHRRLRTVSEPPQTAYKFQRLHAL
jgi:hypothetical protein